MMMVLLMLIAFPAHADVDLPVPEAFQQCSQDSDCDRADTDCGDCCQYQPIARIHQSAYYQLRTRQCANNNGPVCECRPPGEPVFTCENHRCKLSYKNLPVR
ncbi:hypothetical protein GC177_09340 [bacterium]|nr:hypothetical protein [bacterium]